MSPKHTRHLVAFIFILFMGFNRSSAQNSTLTNRLQPITRENADKVVELKQLGYGAVTDTAFSPDGKYFAVGTARGVALYRMDNLSDEPLFLEGGTGTVVFSPDSRIVATSGHLWNLQTGNLLREFEGVSPQFNRDGSHIIFASEQQIVILDVETGKEILRQSVGVDIYRIRLSSDDTTVAIDSSGAITLWNLKTSSQPVTLTTPQYPTIFSGETVFSPNGKSLLHAGFDGYVIWDTKTGEIIRDQDTWFNPDLEAAAFNTDGSQVAIGDANAGITIFDVVTGNSIASFNHESEIRSVALSPDEQYIAAAGINGIVKMWNIKTKAEYATLTGFSVLARVLGFNDADTIVSAASIDGAAWQWDLSSEKQISAIQEYKFYVSHGTVPYPNTIELNNRGNLLATGSVLDGRIHLWTPDGRSRGNFEVGRGQDVIDVAFTQDNSIFAALSFGNIYMWKLQEGARIKGLKVPKSFTTNIAFSPNSQIIAVGDREGNVVLENRTTAHVIAEFQGADGDVNNLTFSPDGHEIAFTSYCWRCSPDGYDYDIQLWDINTKELLYALKGHTGFVSSLAFSPDGSVLASVARDGLRFWDATTGETLASIETSASAMAFNNSGSILATNNPDGTIRLWGVPKA